MVAEINKSEASNDIVWDINDRFSAARAIRIRDHYTGEPTKFAMVYGNKNGKDKPEYTPIRAVSDRYHPLPTESLVDAALAQFDNKIEVSTRLDRAGTRLDVSLLDNGRQIEIGKGRPFDLGHPWSRDLNHVHGTKPTRDVIVPTIDITNSYDATTGVRINIGIQRLICENGAKIMLAGMQIKAIHTIHQIAGAIGDAKTKQLTFDFSRLQSMTTARIDEDMMKAILHPVPEKWHKQFREYTALQKDSAWATLNGLSYLATHEYTLTRSSQLYKSMGLTLASVN